MDQTGLIIGGVSLFIGGILKGATGAGAPLLAIPLLSMLYDVPLAVAVMTVPSLVSNSWQAWHFRKSRPEPLLIWGFAAAGAVGTVTGSLMLAAFAPDLLLLIVALAVLLYISFRLLQPGWRLGEALAARLSVPAGLMGGVLQGATGISAPVSITFLNAISLERATFIVTISTFFAASAVVQIPFLYGLGILSPERMILSIAALAPLFAGMPVGARLARAIDRATFDKIILAILAVISLRLVWSGLV
ncbi:sulfite exporter TauE/SafE family protein [Roseicyclus sp. F158]|uniref:Probable membrane transporter protein n=1 Tax=Tropicimonas omnivorans TaxID=3075590 RepID=A0ABU3DHN5_9RHOB|nr:sulfite exporter TauE/SafE family protein [Roseicyclus sp. F158]MDT0683209.1 sulfite exporter TauE/SafE family protein [Roseicyclus sp. F158]